MKTARWIIGIEHPQVFEGDDPDSFRADINIIVYDDHIMVKQEGTYVRKNGDVRDELHKEVDRLLREVTHYWDEQIEESLS